MFDYMVLAIGAWFLGFFPLAEIYVAVPAALAAGLDHISAWAWAVLGNFTPVVLITIFYDQLMRIERVQAWFAGLVSERIRQRVNRYGLWFVFLLTPWAGVWVMSVAAKVLGLRSTPYMLTAFLSIALYAVVIIFLIHNGLALVTPI